MNLNSDKQKEQEKLFLKIIRYIVSTTGLYTQHMGMMY